MTRNSHSGLSWSSISETMRGWQSFLITRTCKTWKVICFLVLLLTKLENQIYVCSFVRNFSDIHLLNSVISSKTAYLCFNIMFFAFALCFVNNFESILLSIRFVLTYSYNCKVAITCTGLIFFHASDAKTNSLNFCRI